MKLVVCGLPLALSVTLSAAVRCPALEGVNVTPIVQVLLASSELPQASAISAKSPELAPPTESPLMLRALLPLLLKVIV